MIVFVLIEPKILEVKQIWHRSCIFSGKTFN